MGASNEIGALGFVGAMQELTSQEQEMGFRFDAIVHGCSSGGTAAGLEVAKRIYGRKDLKVFSISADDPPEKIGQSVLEAANPILKRLGLRESMEIEDLHIDDAYAGEGYGIPTKLSKKVSEQFLRVEGIMLDPIYTAKAASALVDYGRKGMFSQDDKVLFWHTGGLMNLF